MSSNTFCERRTQAVYRDPFSDVQPSIFVGSVNGVCEGDSVYLIGDPGVSNGFQWMRNGQFVTGANDTILWATEGGWYQFSRSLDSACVRVSDSVWVDILSLVDSASVSWLTDALPGAAMIYMAPSNPNFSSYFWQVIGGSIMAGQNTPSVTVQWNSAPGLAELSLTVTGQGCTDQVSLPINLSGLGADESDAKYLIRLDPNPVTGVSTVELGQGSYSVRVFDLSGRVLSQFDNASGSISINASDYSAGIYVMSVSSERGTASTRFVVR